MCTAAGVGGCSATSNRLRWFRRREHAANKWTGSSARWTIASEPGLEKTRLEAPWAEAYWPQNFTPPRFRAPIVLFKRPKQPYYYIDDPQMGWGARSEGGVEIHEINANHHEVLREPHVQYRQQGTGGTSASMERRLERPAAAGGTTADAAIAVPTY